MISLYPENQESGIRLYAEDDVWQPTPRVQEPGFAMRNFPGTMQELADLQIDPFSLRADPKRVITDYFKGIKDSVVGAGEALSEAGGEVKGGTMSGVIGKSLTAGARTLGAVISPISSAFQAAENIPGWGSAAKLINTAFSALGEGTTAVSDKAIDSIPGLSDEQKENLKPGIAEALSLATQILVAGGVEKGFNIGKPKIQELTSKYGKEDAQRIVEEATRIAKEEGTIQAEMEMWEKFVEQEKQPQKLLQSPEEQAKLSGGDQLLLEGPKQGVGEGFTFTDKVEKSKVQAYKTYTDYATARKAYQKNPTASNLQKLQATREKLDQFRAETPIETITQPERIKTESKGGIRLYDEPKAPVAPPVAPKTAPESTIESKPTKVASDINKQIVEQGFKELPDTELAKYDPISYKRQSQEIAERMTHDFEGLKNMAKGSEMIPNNWSPQLVFESVKKKAFKENDVTTLRDLANSPIATERSLAAQTLGASGYEAFKGTDPVKVMADIRDVRTKGVKDPIKAKSRIKEEIKKEIKKPDAKTWEGFLNELIC